MLSWKIQTARSNADPHHSNAQGLSMTCTQVSFTQGQVGIHTLDDLIHATENISTCYHF